MRRITIIAAALATAALATTYIQTSSTGVAPWKPVKDSVSRAHLADSALKADSSRAAWKADSARIAWFAHAATYADSSRITHRADSSAYADSSRASHISDSTKKIPGSTIYRYLMTQANRSVSAGALYDSAGKLFSPESLVVGTQASAATIGVNSRNSVITGYYMMDANKKRWGLARGALSDSFLLRAYTPSEAIIDTPLAFGVSAGDSGRITRPFKFSSGLRVLGGIAGNAATATKLAAARTIGMSGDVVGTATAFDGTANITIPTTLPTLLTAGSAGSATSVPTLTWDKNGRLMAVGSAAISIPHTQISDWGTYINQPLLTTSSPTFANITGVGDIFASKYMDYGVAGYGYKIGTNVGTVYSSDIGQPWAFWARPFKSNGYSCQMRLGVSTRTADGSSDIDAISIDGTGATSFLQTIYANGGIAGNLTGTASNSLSLGGIAASQYGTLSQDTAIAKKVASDTANVLRSGIASAVTTSEAYATARISDSLTANARAWATLAVLRGGIHDSLTVERAFDSLVARNVTHDSATAMRSYVGGASTTGNAATATKLAATRTIGMSGDLTGTATAFDGTKNITIPTTLPTLLTAGSAGSATSVPTLTWDAKGRLTAVGSAAISIPHTQISDWGTYINQPLLTTSSPTFASIIGVGDIFASKYMSYGTAGYGYKIGTNVGTVYSSDIGQPWAFWARPFKSNGYGCQMKLGVSTRTTDGSSDIDAISIDGTGATSFLQTIYANGGIAGNLTGTASNSLSLGGIAAAQYGTLSQDTAIAKKVAHDTATVLRNSIANSASWIFRSSVNFVASSSAQVELLSFNIPTLNNYTISPTTIELVGYPCNGTPKIKLVINNDTVDVRSPSGSLLSIKYYIGSPIGECYVTINGVPDIFIISGHYTNPTIKIIGSNVGFDYREVM